MGDGIRKHVIIRGRVQGVFFRMETRKQASLRGVTGWVKNLPDQSVEAVFEGDREAVDAVLEWCRQGPPAARVDQVEVVEEPYAGEFDIFEVTY